MTDVEQDITIGNPDVVTKYKTAADISNRVLAKVVKLCTDGAKVIDICSEGDKAINAETKGVYNKGKVIKGVGFPTCISVNNCVCHFSPLPSDPEASATLKEGDLVKIELGAQIDGYAAFVGHTLVVGASAEKPITGRQADVMQAAHLALEAAIRMIKPGGKNMDVTKTVDKIAQAFDTKAVEGMLTHQQEQNIIDGKKTIILNPSENQLRDFERVEFAENEVYAVDILISSGEGKARNLDTRTTVYKKTGTRYDLKMKTSRAALSEIQTKFGNFPFSLRDMEDEKKARMGIQECAKHGVVLPFDVVYDREGSFVAQFLATILLTKNGTLKITSPLFDQSIVKSDKKLEDEEILKLIATSLKPSSKSKKKKAKKEGAATENGKDEE
ncbi:hypothetical protein BZG36_04303 [Bifiguratus adelaidae]|uniref:Peptidase M24 domain-containing protein n=1 Tax=Bifiguratus adelaidae TaxID=1938954 RepID=A0A261XZS6_9FUNG|nr:hypothetical protein BZG36_04303 [Bifiguratus adelaidae]